MLLLRMLQLLHSTLLPSWPESSDFGPVIYVIAAKPLSQAVLPLAEKKTAKELFIM